jgi:signal transduction histidine kinase
LQNLVSNAIKFRSDAPPRIHISARPVAIDAMQRLKYAASARHQTIWQFCVNDNGIGIKEEHAERIFVVFQTLHSRDTFDGTGTGLALCRRIVNLHHGKIWVESREEGGSRFVFTLPSLQP